MGWHRLEVTLTLRGPILSRSSSPGGYGIDAIMVSNAGGQPYLPGTLVKGYLREAWLELAGLSEEFAAVVPLLGRKTGNPDPEQDSEGIHPQRGILRFSDFVHYGDVAADQRHRIRIDPERGAVQKGALQTIETPFASGCRATFLGTIDFPSASDRNADRIRDQVDAGLRWITSLGAGKGIGFGRLLAVAVSDPSDLAFARASSAAIEWAGSTIHVGFILTPEAPFCIAKRRVAHNLFESEESVPGNVIKGCLAATWALHLGRSPADSVREGFDPQRTVLSRHFAALRMTHAHSTALEQRVRPVVPPQSLVKTGESEYRDVALLPEPALLGAPLSAPAFQIDWKAPDLVWLRQEFGWPDISKELRVRTAIDAENRRAKDEQLFAYEMIAPQGHHWLGTIDLTRIDSGDRPAVLRELADLCATPLQGLGKNKTSFRLRFDQTMSRVQDADCRLKDGCWVLTLQTPTVLCDPKGLVGSGRSDAGLRENYREAFSTLSAETLVLERYFARQSLAGGYYLHRRFQEGQEYEPYLLSDPGSVFVLTPAKGQVEAAGAFIEKWSNSGLPLPPWAEERYGADWTACPYLPQNGFGEVAVNLPVHWERKPAPGDCHVL